LVNVAPETIPKADPVHDPQSIRVFLVEDSDLIRVALTQRLEEDPRFTVVGYAETADAAIEALANHLPDVLVTDLHLTQGTGYDVLSYLLRVPPPSPLKCVVFSNFASAAHRRRALQLGASDFFDKSLEFDEMIDELRTWADNSGFHPGTAIQ
jgi:two-component system, NarL family, response regulator DevR